MRTARLTELLSAFWLVVAVITGPWGLSWAASPSTGGAPYEFSGTVDYIDNARNNIVISDREYVLPPTVPVRSGSSTVSRNVLTKGLSVGFNLSDNTVTEIWVLSGR